eukprot:TRINITY_DN3068_c0_g1_i1.p1 TRINITY_DN3068_c0_g1~~TRINITY_DN3068_c0_g1_i1.p1  ORF type:complete len:287 (+),score=64.85 TRINITY_DN3068_c0_g1_i1:25-885(+)
MIFLEDANAIIMRSLTKRAASERKDAMEVTIADFDGVKFHMTADASKPHIVQLSISWSCFGDLKKYGAGKMIDAEYGSAKTKTVHEYDLTINVDITKPKEIEKAALLRRNLLAAPIREMFDGKNKSNLTLNYRADEAMFLKPVSGQVNFMYSVAFRDPDDIVFAKVFLQEFVDARRHVTNAPAVTFSAKEPPGDLKSFGVKPQGNMAYVSILLFERNMKAKNREEVISLTAGFRDYLHYHIKCAKAYLHTRMRKRVDLWLRVLNKAKPEPMHKEKKTFQGKTFTRN